MQFFEQQDQARGRTTLLVSLFFVAVLGLVVAASAATHFVLALEHPPGEPYTLAHLKLVGTAAIVTTAVIFFGSAYRLLQLRGGGVKVAETLGGTLVHPGTTDLLERRVINVVEEMAIAAGLPVPPVYLMAGETGINAFAAGWSPNDAVIGVTRGTLEGLSRDQLQGVIAHEFSHILNRDCALNMRLMGVLHGIVVISIIGRILIQMGTGSRHRTTSKSDGAIQFAVVGAAIWLFGSLGVLLARIIQSAVSRQREFLADASAVQFTRNPEGIGGALATIGSQSSVLSTPRGGETSHMLIGEPSQTSFFGLASHPPLFERIKRVLPQWDGEFATIATPPGSVIKALQSSSKETPNDEISGEEVVQDLLTGGVPTMGGGIPGAGGMAEAVVGGLILEGAGGQPASPQTAATSPSQAPPLTRAAQLLSSIPQPLRAAAAEPFAARALIFAWLLDEDPSARATQLAILGGDPALTDETERLHTFLPSSTSPHSCRSSTSPSELSQLSPSRRESASTNS